MSRTTTASKATAAQTVARDMGDMRREYHDTTQDQTEANDGHEDRRRADMRSGVSMACIAVTIAIANTVWELHSALHGACAQHKTP